VRLDALVPYARNSRTHSVAQVDQIAASIAEFGFTNPVLIDEHGGIIAGHGRVLGARKLGLEEVPCIRLSHLTELQRRAYVIADNKLALNAGWDDEMLARELQDLARADYRVELTGFGDDEIAQLMASVDLADDTDADPDAAPEPQADIVTRPGDVWHLGAHRLVCGDATHAETYAALLGSERADIAWTDPPYNVDVEGKAGKIANDHMGDAAFRQFLTDALTCMEGAMRPGAAIYVAHAETERLNFSLAFRAAGFKLSGLVIWRKDAMTLGRSDYQWIHEPILYGWKPGAAHRWYGGRAQVTVNQLGSHGSAFTRRLDGRWQVTVGEETMIVSGDATVEWVEASVMRELRPKRSDLHPTMKPVALIERMLRNNAKPGAIVLDAFGGSGSTLIAAERLDMRARLIELDPRFADVIVRRWQEFAGGRATRASDGRCFAELAA
jgi:DNA modification methylase